MNAISLASSLWISAMFALGGLLGGALLAVLLAPISVQRRGGFFGEALAVSLKSVPAFIFPLVFGSVVGPGPTMKMAVSALICFFPILVGLLEGRARIPATLLRIAEVYGATSRRRLVRLEAPWLVTGMLEGLKAAAPLAVVGAIVAEYVDAGDTSMAGLGVLFATNRNSRPTLVVVSAAATLLGCGLYFLVARLKTTVDRRFRLV